MSPHRHLFGSGILATTALAAALTAMTAAPAVAQTQVNAKWITMVLPVEPPDLEGCQAARQHQGRVVKQNIVETLVERSTSDFSLKPRLATSWEQLDPSTWRFKLREGVTFHDGSPFNAAAVKRSLDRTLSAPLVCSDKSKAFSGLTIDVKPIDDLTVEIKTSNPDPILPMRLAGIVIVGPNTTFDKFVPSGQGAVGTGPYMFDSWQVGQQILLKRNDKYWGTKPPVEGVRYIWRDESSVRAAMVKLGEADIALGIAQQDAVDPELDFSALNSETLSLRIDATLPPLNDKRVRQAMNYALDRASMIGTVLPKSTLPATQIVVPGIPGHNFELDKRVTPYDPAKARQLLAAAKADGVPVDTEIVLISYPSNFANAGELMEGFHAMFKAVGFNMKLMTVEPGQYAKWNNKPYPDPRAPYLIQSSHDNLAGDPVFSVFIKYGCEGASSGFCDPLIDKEVARVSALGGDARVKGWQEIFRTLYEDLYADVTMYHLVGFTRVGKRVKFVPDVSTNNELRIETISFK